MSQLAFDGVAHTLTLLTSKGAYLAGPWPANNVVASNATLRYVPNGTHAIIDPAHPHMHDNAKHKGILDDSTNGAYGPSGIIRLSPFKVGNVVHSGVGIHSGRANIHAQDSATMGCIRTTDEAMATISHFMASDHLTQIIVRNNHDQHNRQPSQRGDQHSQPTKPGLSGKYALV